MSSESAFDLNQTIAAAWRLRLMGDKPDEKVHWRTKTAYYRAVMDLLAADHRRPLTWRVIVDAVLPKGSRSTFYEVTGPRSKHALLNEYVTASRSDTLQVALCYKRRSAVEQLIDETKVWAFWPYRQGWLHHRKQVGCVSVPDATDALIAVVAEWARRYPQLAAALDHSPPTCSVEDLVAINRGQLPAIRAHATLSDAMRRTAGASGDLVLGVVDAARQGLPGTAVGPPTPDALVLDLAERIHAVTAEIGRSKPGEGNGAREVVAALLTDAVVRLGSA